MSSSPYLLKAFIGTEELRIYQNLEPCEILFKIETKNRYTIHTSEDEPLMLAVEKSFFLCRWICKKTRPFQMSIFDNEKREIISLRRPLACSGCLCACCPLQKIDVYAPPDEFAGTVKEKCSCWSCKFSVKDGDGNTVFKIRGPCYASSLVGPFLCADFSILNMSGEEIGSIKKKWSGILREVFSNSDFFSVKFPRELHYKMKAVLLSACFLIDFMYYEK